MSDGIRSGVNWIRLNERSNTLASVLTSSVLARPGAPVIRQCPPESRAISICSTTSSCPMMTFRSSLPMRSRAPESFSAISSSRSGDTATVVGSSSVGRVGESSLMGRGRGSGVVKNQRIKEAKKQRSKLNSVVAPLLLSYSTLFLSSSNILLQCSSRSATRCSIPCGEGW